MLCDITIFPFRNRLQLCFSLKFSYSVLVNSMHFLLFLLKKIQLLYYILPKVAQIFADRILSTDYILIANQTFISQQEGLIASFSASDKLTCLASCNRVASCVMALFSQTIVACQLYSFYKTDFVVSNSSDIYKRKFNKYFNMDYIITFLLIKVH